MIQQIVALMIPLVSIVMGIGIGMVAIYFNYRKRKEMFALYHQERMAAIEKGIDLPPLPEAFFAEDGQNNRPPSPHRHLMAGLILFFLGAAIMTSIYIEFQAHFVWGLIPTGLGLAFLIYYFAVDRKKILELEAREKAAASEGRPLP